MNITVDCLIFVEGHIHELQCQRNSDFLYELWRKILWPWSLNPTNAWVSLYPRKLVPTKIKPSAVRLNRCVHLHRTWQTLTMARGWMPMILGVRSVYSGGAWDRQKWPDFTRSGVQKVVPFPLPQNTHIHVSGTNNCIVYFIMYRMFNMFLYSSMHRSSEDNQ